MPARCAQCFNPRLLVDEQATYEAEHNDVADIGFNPRLLVDEQATSTRRMTPIQRCFNPRLLVDEQATRMPHFGCVNCSFQPTPAR